MFGRETGIIARAQSTESNSRNQKIISHTPDIEQLHDAWTKFKDYENSNEAFLNFIKILASDEYAPENLSDPYAWDNIAQALEESMVTTVVDFLDKHGEQCSLVLFRLAKSSAYVRKQLGGLECNMEKLLRRLNDCRKFGFKNQTDINLVMLLKVLFDPYQNSEMMAYNNSNHKQAKPSDGIAKVDSRLKELFKECFEKPNQNQSSLTFCYMLEIFHSCLAGSRSNADFLTSSTNNTTPNSSSSNVSYNRSNLTNSSSTQSNDNGIHETNKDNHNHNHLPPKNHQVTASSFSSTAPQHKKFTNLFAQILFIADYSSKNFKSNCDSIYHQLIRIIIFLWQRYQHTKFITECLWPLLLKQSQIVTSIFLQNVIQELQSSNAHTVLHNIIRLGYLKKCLEIFKTNSKNNSSSPEIIDISVLLTTIQKILHGASVIEIEYFEKDFGYENLGKILLKREK